MDYIPILDTALQVTGVLNILSGVPGSVKMWKTGKTDGWPTLFFVIGLCGAVGMTYYGFLQNNSTLLMLNGLQATINIYYILSFLVLSDAKGEAITYLAGAGAYLVGLYVFYSRFDNNQLAERLNLLGSSSSAIFLIMNSSTILDVISAMKSKTITFDLTMLICGMVVNALWLTYGLLLNDMFIAGPAMPFVLVGLMKFMLMTIYTRKEKKKAE